MGNILQNILVVWQKTSLVQRAMLFAILMACLISGGLLTRWATSQDMRLLFGALSLEEAAKIAEKVSQKDVPYELRAGGTSVYVPADKVLLLRAELAREGLPSAAEPGYKVFDDEKIGVSPLVQKINYNRALQGELARTIQMFDGIITARVHIVRPEQVMFNSTGSGATASVMLQLKPGWKLPPSTVAAITNLVAGATEGLKPENVTVTDSNGTLLTSSGSNNGVVTTANTFMDYKERVERAIAGSIEDMLEGPLGPGRCKVGVNAVIDMTTSQTRMTTYEKGQPSEETINSTSTVKPGSTNAEGKESSPGSQDKQETIENKYKVPETIVTKLDVPGKIVSLSVSAVVDLSAPKPAQADKAGQEQSTTETALIMSVSDVEELIRNAVGRDLLKEAGSLTVKNVSFHKPVPLSREASSYDRTGFYLEIVRHSSLGIMAVCALIVLKIFAGARKKAAGAQVPPGGKQASLEMTGAAAFPGSSLPGEPVSMMRRQIAGFLKDNPEQVRQVLGSWLAEEK